MKAYSKDLRLKVLDAVDRGMPRKEVARIFGISLPSIKRWLKLRRESGDVEPSPIPGPPAKKGAMLEGWLPGQLQNEPDLRLEEHCEAFEEASGVKVSTATMSRRISGLPGGWPLKKSPESSLRARRGEKGALALAGEPLRRQAAGGVHRRERVPSLHDAPQSKSPQRRAGLHGKVPRNRGKKNQTLIASITLEGGMGEALAIKGSTDAELFEAYVERTSSLRRWRPDRGRRARRALGAHRTGRVRELIEARGAELLFLPSYSPDLNPIEEAFSKMKNILRKAQARTREALNEAISEAMSAAITLEDVAGWFLHCGYEPQDQYS